MEFNSFFAGVKALLFLQFHDFCLMINIKKQMPLKQYIHDLFFWLKAAIYYVSIMLDSS